MVSNFRNHGGGWPVSVILSQVRVGSIPVLDTFLRANKSIVYLIGQSSRGSPHPHLKFSVLKNSHPALNLSIY